MNSRHSPVRLRMQRFFSSNLGGFAGGSAVDGPLGMLAVEQERLAGIEGSEGIFRR